METVFAFVLAVAVLLGGGIYIDAVACESKYAQYGETDYGPIQGCMVTKPDGKRVPAEAIREI
jgi:hypothetical protein